MEFESQIAYIQMMAWDNFLDQIYPWFIREQKSSLSVWFFNAHFQQIEKQHN